MADIMTFPETFEEFIKQYEFEDKEEVYTNGAELIPSFRVMQAWDHYTSDIINALANIRECTEIIDNNLYNIEDML